MLACVGASGAARAQVSSVERASPVERASVDLRVQGPSLRSSVESSVSAAAVSLPQAGSELRASPGRLPSATADESRALADRSGLVWRERWRRFTVGEALFSGVMTGAAVGTYAFPPHGEPNWLGGIALDDATRDGLTLRDYGARETAASLSDGLVIGLATLPVLLDALLITWAGHGSSDVALQMLLMNFQAHAMAQGLTGLVKWGVRRERPIARSCREDPVRAATDPSCAEGQIEPASFFSGHSSLAFTSAALICLHHTEMGLLGEAGDAAACVSALALATGVGTLRMMAERHYLSDVLIGAGVGLISGWLMPWVLHYAQFGGGPDSDFRAAVAPSFDQNNLGLQVMGTF